MIYDDVTRAADSAGLLVMGAFHPERGTLILLGAGGGFWPVFSAAPEAVDGAPDPIDRWSMRIVGALAAQFDARARFPFGGPPYEPFIRWALQSGRAFTSPTGMLVHDRVGMMISYRGALLFDDHLTVPAAVAPSPCTDCVGQPCTTACPVSALSAGRAYDLPACHNHLDTAAGADCMASGCAARHACPRSAGARRSADQSAHHMRAFHSP